ncbi:MAG: hypothetical protein ACLUPL_10040 [Butyricimonas virosa]
MPVFMICGTLMTPQDNYYTINDVTSIYPSSDDFRKEYLVITNSNGYDISVKYADVDSENGGKFR